MTPEEAEQLEGIALDKVCAEWMGDPFDEDFADWVDRDEKGYGDVGWRAHPPRYHDDPAAAYELREALRAMGRGIVVTYMRDGVRAVGMPEGAMDYEDGALGKGATEMQATARLVAKLKTMGVERE